MVYTASFLHMLMSYDWKIDVHEKNHYIGRVYRIDYNNKFLDLAASHSCVDQNPLSSTLISIIIKRVIRPQNFTVKSEEHYSVEKQ